MVLAMPNSMRNFQIHAYYFFLSYRDNQDREDFMSRYYRHRRSSMAMSKGRYFNLLINKQLGG